MVVRTGKRRATARRLSTYSWSKTEVIPKVTSRGAMLWASRWNWNHDILRTLQTLSQPLIIQFWPWSIPLLSLKYRSPKILYYRPKILTLSPSPYPMELIRPKWLRVRVPSGPIMKRRSPGPIHFSPTSIALGSTIHIQSLVDLCRALLLPA